MSYTTGAGDEEEGIPPFTFRWHGPNYLIPIAGTYVGENALSEFFGAVNSLTVDFSFDIAFYPPGPSFSFSFSEMICIY